MTLELDQHNIVKFLGWYNLANEKVLMFEALPMEIEDYNAFVCPLTLSDIRTVIQQV